ncbi:MAG TPA: type II secretion system major pseudopilin GspG [Verrucomicrobiota bacterium]|nr:type II secretion system major pseudopilin GspG [Verrucomicrobiota bacterium]HOK77965.1 type II secretion system major pseudopilin GspG [Verrucomicrobiota bacterium]
MNTHRSETIIVRTLTHGSNHRRRSAGFTLVELLLVLVILGTLAALVLPRFAGTSERARKTAALTQISTFKTALNAYEVDNGSYPKSLQDLVEQPRDAQNWHGPYLDGAVPLDPWKNAYIYVYPGRHNPNGYDLSSMGPDGREGTEDDITNWQTPTQASQP